MIFDNIAKAIILLLISAFTFGLLGALALTSSYSFAKIGGAGCFIVAGFALGLIIGNSLSIDE